MICSECGAELEFIKFEREVESFLFYALFQCYCPGFRAIKEEDCISFGLLTHEEIEQLRTFKLLCLGKSLDEDIQPLSVYLRAFIAQKGKLQAYIRDFSESFHKREYVRQRPGSRL